jgi:hypothetical protein
MVPTGVGMPHQLPNQRIRRAFLTDEYKKAGIPVYESSYHTYLEKWKPACEQEYTCASEFMGLYFTDKGAALFGFPQTFILINQSLPNYEKLMIFWHEVGHHSCVKSRCLCAVNAEFEFRKTELHAELACIHIASARGYRGMTLQLLQEAVEDLLNTGNRSFDYIRNATMMVKHPSFTAAVALVHDEFFKWLNSHRLLKERYEVALLDSSTRTCRWQPSNYLKRFTTP